MFIIDTNKDNLINEINEGNDNYDLIIIPYSKEEIIKDQIITDPENENCMKNDNSVINMKTMITNQSNIYSLSYIELLLIII